MTDQMTRQLIRELGQRAAEMPPAPEIARAVVERAQRTRRRRTALGGSLAAAVLVAGAAIGTGAARLHTGAHTTPSRPTPSSTGKPTTSPSTSPTEADRPQRAAGQLAAVSRHDAHPISVLGTATYSANGGVHRAGRVTPLPKNRALWQLTPARGGSLVTFYWLNGHQGTGSSGLSYYSDATGRLVDLPGATEQMTLTPDLAHVASVVQFNDADYRLAWYDLPSGNRVAMSLSLPVGLSDPEVVGSDADGSVVLTDDGGTTYTWVPGEPQPVLEKARAIEDRPRWLTRSRGSFVDSRDNPTLTSYFDRSWTHLSVADTADGTVRLNRVPLPASPGPYQAAWAGPQQVAVTLRTAGGVKTGISVCSLATQSCSSPVTVSPQVILSSSASYTETGG